MKAVAKDYFLDFFDVPMDDARRTREGVYTSYSFGPHGKRLQIILLDGRWFKSGESYLGDEQWAWLAEEFAKPADLRILVNGYQVRCHCPRAGASATQPPHNRHTTL